MWVMLCLRTEDLWEDFCCLLACFTSLGYIRVLYVHNIHDAIISAFFAPSTAYRKCAQIRQELRTETSEFYKLRHSG